MADAVDEKLFAHQLARQSGAATIPALPCRSIVSRHAPSRLRRLGRLELTLQRLAAHQPRLHGGRRDPLAHHRAAQRTDPIE
jgi:hypothetical protein